MDNFKFHNKILSDSEKAKLAGSLETYYENHIDNMIDQYCPGMGMVKLISNHL
jgi:hypothetical protein